jgi:hypothetical protein
VIPTRKNQVRDADFDKASYRRRNIIERAVGWFKWCRALATRFDKLAVNYVALWIIANSQYLLRKYLVSRPGSPVGISGPRNRIGNRSGAEGDERTAGGRPER